MSEIIVAVYENGVLRPVNPVSLNEGQTVRLQVVLEVSPGESQNEVEKPFQSLVDQKVMSLPPKQGQIDRAELARREEARRERMQKMGPIPGKPLSETIIEDRGPW
ncbi:antitoxin family protein [Planktothrix sp. FACHB-1355]|uniref:Antitoxin family protein n=1 Tax=Aerosakkonema funiforme FACHB-1375 TaxID=2949571 RepID=A0A926ZHX9_9CYAN|nr:MULTISPECIES: antitoxin family protein [Oscillatoriales]MBD2181221.1 antitoxin family protein [Aerosakkonema funiforme FACHB-1375]MBD3562844.1 antitoxin family protein [Planktothrix sp. FACHB-1355]